MKFLKTLLGKDEGPPKWDIKPPADRPEPRQRAKAEEPPLPKKQKKEPDPFLDDEFLDTLSLEADVIPEDNPYQTLSWEQSMENGTRDLKNTQIGARTEKPVDSQYNPYDTGTMRRGWKK